MIARAQLPGCSDPGPASMPRLVRRDCHDTGLALRLCHRCPQAAALRQAAKTYLERHFEAFAGASLDELIQHALRALDASLQDDSISKANCVLGIVGPDTPFTILEDQDLASHVSGLQEGQPGRPPARALQAAARMHCPPAPSGARPSVAAWHAGPAQHSAALPALSQAAGAEPRELTTAARLDLLAELPPRSSSCSHTCCAHR